MTNQDGPEHPLLVDAAGTVEEFREEVGIFGQPFVRSPVDARYVRNYHLNDVGGDPKPAVPRPKMCI